MDKLLPWISYINALGVGLIAAMVTALAIQFVPIRGAPDWTLWAVFLLVAVGYGLYTRRQS
ncbi:hypothetical protein [Halobaculum sp. D14]|uniref:hypothetical protein n=1 Tax=Halobaculum sp. D14 TaxID=3421642 RepID=UPI003EBEBC83